MTKQGSRQAPACAPAGLAGLRLLTVLGACQPLLDRNVTPTAVLLCDVGPEQVTAPANSVRELAQLDSY